MKQRFQGIVIGIIISIITLTSLTVFAGTSDFLFNIINIKINGDIVANIGDGYNVSSSEQVPYSIMYKGTTYLPMRKLAELLNKYVTYDSGTKTASVNDSI